MQRVWRNPSQPPGRHHPAPQPGFDTQQARLNMAELPCGMRMRGSHIAGRVSQRTRAQGIDGG